ncbi:MAG: tetratricopeptide repeat protein [Symploca sp. SIO2G7]|nr:tetratricopeptide repeat protein [Symploca sp. SIO2G7]
MEHHQQQLAKLEQAIKHNPEDEKAIAHRGEVYRLMGRYEEALADFDQAIKLKPEYYWAIAHRGEIYYHKEEYEKALADFNRALQVEPNYLWAIAHRGVTYEYMRHDEEAIADLNRALAIKPDYSWAFAHRSRTYEQMKLYEQALADFDQAIALDQNAVKAWKRERGLLLSFLGRYAESVEYYEQGLQENPEDYFGLYGLVSTNACWKGLAETQSQINETRQLFLSLTNTEAAGIALYGLGGLAALEGKVKEALNYLQEAISVDDYRADTANHDRVWLPFYSNLHFQALISKVMR